jgi:hypothetical protein
MNVPENITGHIDRIGIEEYLNCILVEAGARPACMLQPPDYGEVSAADPIIHEKLIAIKEAFPELIQSIVTYGVIISKHAYTNDDIPSHETLGKILGYICAGDFEDVVQNDETQYSVSYSMRVLFKDGAPFRPVQLFVDRCKDTRTRGAHEEQRARVEEALKRDARVKTIIKSVKLDEQITVPPAYILNKLVTKQELSPVEKSEMVNYIANIGFEGDILEYPFNIQNEFQRGILVALMTHYIHNPLEPLFPITRYPQYEDILDKTRKWEDTLYLALQGQQGGRRRYKKTRKVRKTK